MVKKVSPLVALLFVACEGNIYQFENPCIDVDCGSKGRCAVGAEGAICICDHGFVLKAGVCTEILEPDNPCEGIVCAGNGVCALAHNDAPVCLCRPGYLADGAKCVEVEVEQVPPSPCEGVSCGGHGSCVVTAANKPLCVCDQGHHLEGNDCVATTGPCFGFDCGDNGFCVVTTANEPLCVCNEGYRLDDNQCVLIEDPCSDVDCSGYGTCVVSGSGAALCVCNEGYHPEGNDCIATTNPCKDVDCGDNGRCALGAEGPICVCDQGFILQEGVCTEIQVDNPCEGIECDGNGVCALAHDNTAICLCRPGYHSDGAQCVEDEVPDSPCADVDCSENGSCVVTAANEALCICDQGYLRAGNDCIPDPCLGVNCGSHGACVVSSTNQPLCVCDEGYQYDGNACVQIDTCVGFGFCSDDWCLIPGCTFKMGSPVDEACRVGNEGPVQMVRITRPFYMKQTEVTQKEWFDLIGNRPSFFPSCDDCPVDSVNWYDAAYYANMLSAQENLEPCYSLENCTGTLGLDATDCEVTFEGLQCKGYRLPTEAEWEHAARAGTTTPYWIGGNIGYDYEPVCDDGDPSGTGLAEIAWYSYNSDLKTHTVAQKLPNPWGLYDVYGNVWEWVHDWYTQNRSVACDPDCRDPLGPDTGLDRVIRGGSWGNDAGWIRSALRHHIEPGDRNPGTGFRLARSLP